MATRTRLFALAHLLFSSTDAFTVLIDEPLRRRAFSAVMAKSSTHEERNIRPSSCGGDLASMTRSTFVTSSLAGILFPFLFSLPTNSFEGGIGGLGKTKPSTGVVFFDSDSVPLQKAQGEVSAELAIGGKPVRVAFTTPWSLLSTTSGLEARDLQTSESAFVQVIEGVRDVPSSKTAFRDLLLDSVLAQQGKFGAYGSPTDVKVKAVEGRPNVYSVTFTTLTPGLHETERQLLVGAKAVAGSIILLVVGSTRQRFKQNHAIMESIVDSFQAFEAPATRLR